MLHHLTLREPAEKRAFQQAVWDLLAVAYQEVEGGLYYADLEEMVNTTSEWQIALADGHLIAALLFKAKKGRKMVAFGATADSDLRKLGKQALAEMIGSQLGSAWLEVSEKAERFVMGLGGACYLIENRWAAKLTGKPLLGLCDDGVHYIREICGFAKRKIIVGTPAF